MKKLLNKKGSVLFLVIVVMSILIVAASATFYIVNNQHSSTVVRYDSEQSYQTAATVSRTVSDYIDGYLEAISKSGKELSEYKTTIIGKMMSMSTGGTEDITSAINLNDEGLGDANILIKKTGTRAKGDNTVHIFEISTTATVDGETFKLTQVKEIITGPVEYFTRFLTSTGERKEDVIFAAYSIMSDAYFENDYTVLGINIGATRLNDSLYSSGTLVDRGIQFADKPDKYEVVIAEDLILQGAGQHFMNYGGEAYIGGSLTATSHFMCADKIYVKGNLTANSTTMYTNTVDTESQVFVNGDCILNGSSITGTLYINGDLYVRETTYYSTVGLSGGKYYVKGNVYVETNLNPYNAVLHCGGSIIESGGVVWNGGDVVQNDSDVASTISGAVDWADVSNHIASSTSKNKYQRWEAEKYFNKQAEGEAAQDVYPGKIEINEWGSLQTNNDVITITENCVLHSAEGWNNENGWQPHNIVIDATSQDIYIKLQPLDGSDTFSFTNGGSVNIYVKGSHSVIFILQEGHNFKMDGSSYIGHMGFVREYSGLSEEDLLTQNGAYAYGSLFGNDKRDTAMPIVEGWFEKEDDSANDSPYIIKESVFEITDSTVHNNIFLVTNDKNSMIDFTNGSTFCGYVYAPNSKLVTLQEGTDGSGKGISFIGGMIVGSYSYTNYESALIFTTPYDYADNYGLSKKTDIVKYLINLSNSGSPSGDSGTLQGWQTAGYK